MVSLNLTVVELVSIILGILLSISLWQALIGNFGGIIATVILIPSIIAILNIQYHWIELAE